MGYATDLRLQDVMVKALYGHREWIWWKNKEGVKCTSRLNAEAMKRCLLDVGTQGKWMLVCADGTTTIGYWYLGVIQVTRLRSGKLHGNAFTEDRVMRLGR